MKQRIITAIVLIVVLVPIVIYGNLPYTLGVSFLGVIGLYELTNLRGKKKVLPKPMKIISYALILLLILSNEINSSVNLLIDTRVITLIIFLLTIPIIFYSYDKYNITDALFLIGSIFFLGISFNLFLTVRNTGLNYLIFLLLITIFTDTFAYFTGLLIGKHKMSPNISPNKTWEGFVGGLIFGTFISTSFYCSAFSFNGSLISLVLVIAFLSIVGQLGDLVFSAIKRYYGVKDYSNLLPGHGGILDRVDSILFVLLAFSFISSFL